jgi:hypothetical protein
MKVYLVQIWVDISPNVRGGWKEGESVAAVMAKRDVYKERPVSSVDDLLVVTSDDEEVAVCYLVAGAAARKVLEKAIELGFGEVPEAFYAAAVPKLEAHQVPDGVL